MDPRVKALFDALADKPHAEREDALAQAAADGCPPEVIAEVRRLLSIKTAESPTVASPDIDRVRAAAAHAAALLGDRAGEWIGPYKLLELVGEGGFGVVWLAERREPMVQRVAIKIIKPGMDSKAVNARFEQERQALAVMDHPNVAKVLDGGVTPSGRPYFVMEHVKGEPITSVADNHRLTIQQRLELFISVCDAVQHAHMKGIIHRDLKPSNILVTFPGGDASGDSSRGMLVKVIDFGVAKAISHTLTDKTIFTERGQIIGTPEYMSPEQAEMGAIDIDTRTDVYSLGVVLYELLCGALPFDSHSLRSAGYAEIQRIIREVDPPRPSTRLSTADDVTAAAIAKARHADREKIAKELRRELEWIPLKALRKDRRERYATPRDLAEDVQRYLKGDPLDAGPESTAYRLRKILKRHRGPAFAAAAVLLALLLGLGGTLWKADEARRETERANLEATRANAEASAAREQSERADAKAAEADAQRQKAIDASKKIEYNSYVANIQMAGAAMEMRLFDRVRQRLDACPEQLRGWEWDWLNAEADSSLAVLRGHTAPVVSATFSPDGQRIVTASRDGTARVWDALRGMSVAELREHTSAVTSAAFSPDGTRIVTASDDKTARVWDAATGETLVELKGHTNVVTSATFSFDGTQIVTASMDGNSQVWNAKTGAVLAKVRSPRSDVASAAFSSDGTRIVTVSRYGLVEVWDAKTGESVAPLVFPEESLAPFAFSSDGSMGITACADGIARVWDPATGESLTTLEVPNKSLAFAAFNSDGTRIVTAFDDGTGRVWAVERGGERLADLNGDVRLLRSATFSSDSARLLTVFEDGRAQIWDARTGQSLAELKGHTAELTTAAFSPDGTRIVTASSDGSARVWDAAAGSSLAKLTVYNQYRPLHSAVFSPDGTRIVTASDDGSAQVWSAKTGEILAELWGIHAELGGIHGRDGGMTSVAFSPDGTRVWTASGAGRVTLWDAETGESLAELKYGNQWLTSVAFSPDGARIFTYGTLLLSATGHPEDAGGVLWDAKTRERIAELRGIPSYGGGMTSAAFSPDGTRIVTVSGAACVEVWDAKTGERFAELKFDLSLEPISAAFSPEGTRIVAVYGAGSVEVWDARTAESLAELRYGNSRLTCATFSPDGMRIVTGSEDGNAQVWNAKTGALLAELRSIAGHDRGMTSAAFSPDGTRIVTASEDGRVKVWDAKTGESLAELKYGNSWLTSVAFSPDGTRILAIAERFGVRVWESRPYREHFPAIQTARTAEAKVQPIVASRLAAGESLQAIRRAAVAEASITEVERRAWMTVTAKYSRHAPFYATELVHRLHLGFELLVDSPYTSEVSSVADHLRGICGDNAYELHAVGVAYVRLGRQAEALEMLYRSESGYEETGVGQQPSNWAFIAAAYGHLGQSEQARAALSTFRILAATDKWKDDVEVLAWSKELDSLIPPEP